MNDDECGLCGERHDPADHMETLRRTQPDDPEVVSELLADPIVRVLLSGERQADRMPLSGEPWMCPGCYQEAFAQDDVQDREGRWWHRRCWLDQSIGDFTTAHPRVMEALAQDDDAPWETIRAEERRAEAEREAQRNVSPASGDLSGDLEVIGGQALEDHYSDQPQHFHHAPSVAGVVIDAIRNSGYKIVPEDDVRPISGEDRAEVRRLLERYDRQVARGQSPSSFSGAEVVEALRYASQLDVSAVPSEEEWTVERPVHAAADPMRQGDVWVCICGDIFPSIRALRQHVFPDDPQLDISAVSGVVEVTMADGSTEPRGTGFIADIPYASTRMDALRRLQSEGYAVVMQEAVERHREAQAEVERLRTFIHDEVVLSSAPWALRARAQEVLGDE